MHGSTRSPQEKEIQRQIMQYLTLARCVPIRVNSGMFVLPDPAGGPKRRVFRGNSEDGCSDLIVCVPCWFENECGRIPIGRFLAIEVKRDKKSRMTMKQRGFAGKIEQANGVFLCAYDLDQVKAQLVKMNAIHIP